MFRWVVALATMARVDYGPCGLINKRPASILLVDETEQGDRRVMSARAELPEPVDVVDLRCPEAPTSSGTRRRVARLLARAALEAPRRYWRLRPLLDGRVTDEPLAGMSASLGWLDRAVRAAQGLEALATANPPGVIHANDLYCALAASLVSWPSGTHLIYDSHELQIHRNRKAGWGRILLEHALESLVLARAHEVRVVNHAIARAMATTHRIDPSRFRVVHNDFYEHLPMPASAAAGAPAIVYVGQGVRGRHLEDLDKPAGELPLEVHVFTVGARLPDAIDGGAWHLDASEAYQRGLDAVVASRRAVMWCCLEATCLSYSMALPNKFFQAMAVGIPIVASDGTYLADLVREHGIGVIYDGKSLDALSAQIASPKFRDWSKAVASFREQLWAERLAI